jgi:hypothetical protein
VDETKTEIDVSTPILGEKAPVEETVPSGDGHHD